MTSEKILHTSRHTIREDIEDYLELAIKSHVIASIELFKSFKGTQDISVKRVLRAKIFSEYVSALEDLYAVAFAINQAHLHLIGNAPKYTNYRDAFFRYTNKELNDFIKDNSFKKETYSRIFGFPNEAIISTFWGISGERILDAIEYSLVEMKDELLRTLPIFFKIKHGFIVRNKGPKISGFKGDEVYVVTAAPEASKQDFIVRGLPLELALVNTEVSNIKVVESAAENLLRIYLKMHEPSKNDNIV